MFGFFFFRFLKNMNTSIVMEVSEVSFYDIFIETWRVEMNLCYQIQYCMFPLTMQLVRFSVVYIQTLFVIAIVA